MAARILVVTDEPWARNEAHAALTEPDFTLVDHTDPTTTADAVATSAIDAVLVDLQIGSMGGMAVARDMRQHANLAGAEPVPVVLLLDRMADSFLAKRAGAAAWVTKPFTAHDLRTAVDEALQK